MSRKDAEKAIAELLCVNMNRAELIVTTETTYAYNRGRLSSFHQNDVDYVRFSAVMDARTSPQCRSRHGLIMAMDDPRLPSNTPPLHGRCRSILTPIYSAYQPELITKESLDWSDVKPLPKGWRTT
jgi:SPP1 gp7 family putative phage head morphogenesis protein